MSQYVDAMVYNHQNVCTSSDRCRIMGKRREGAVFYKRGEVCEQAVLVIASVLAFHMLMLIETPVGSTIINGVQGRYFIAWLPLILMITSGKEIVIEKVKVKRLYFYFSVASAFYFYFFLINIFGLK